MAEEMKKHDDNTKEDVKHKIQSSSLPSYLIFRPDNTLFNLDLNLDETGNTRLVENKITPLQNPEFKTPSSRKIKYKSCRPLGSSNGLVCVYVPAKKSIYIWNPTTNVTRHIGFPRVASDDSYSVGRTGFGFVPSINDYKLVMVIRAKHVCEIHVCSLKQNKWEIKWNNISCDNNSYLKDILVSEIVHGNYKNESFPIAINDSLHWIVGPYKKSIDIKYVQHYIECYFILKFDMVNELFERTSDLRQLNRQIEGSYRVDNSLGVTKSNKLCVCQFYDTTTWRYEEGLTSPCCIEIWMSEKCGGALDFCWKKVVNFPGNWCQPGTDHSLLQIIGGGKVVILEKYKSNMKSLLVLDGRQRPPVFVEVKNEYCAPYDIEETMWYSYIITYERSSICPHSI